MEKPPISASQLEEIERLFDYYDRVSSVRIPPTLKDAVEEGWELLQVEELQVASTFAKPGDRSRVMPMRAALRLLDEFEASMIEKHTLSRNRLADSYAHLATVALRTVADSGPRAWKTLSALWDVGGFFLDSLWKHPEATLTVLAAALQLAQKAVEAIWEGWSEALKVLLVSWAVVHFKRSAEDLFKVRDDFTNRARKRCFPQRNASRVRRRKVARL